MKKQLLRLLSGVSLGTLALGISVNSAFAVVHVPDDLYNRPTLAQVDQELTKVVYGADDRVEAFEHPDRRLRDMAQGVAGMVAKHHLAEETSRSDLERLRELLDPDLFEKYYEFFSDMAGRSKNKKLYTIRNQSTLADSYQVCQNERFANQKILPICTGFLIAPDILLTAGHCVRTQSACDNYVWVFGYTDKTNIIAKQDVYGCKEVMDQKYSTGLFSAKDYAIIKLERKSDHTPLELRTNGSVDKGDDVAVIGHPSGLPLKTADNAKVMKNYLYTFKTNLDTFAGNSGSPVINVREGVVEGILVEGADDYVIDRKNSCRRVAYRSSGRSESKERVFKVTRIKELDEILD